MNILYTIKKFPITGGSSILVQGLSQTLTKFGHKSIIFTSDEPTKLKIESTENYTIKRIPIYAYDFLFKSIFKNESSLLFRFLKRTINSLEWFFIHKINSFAKKHSLPLIWGLFLDLFGWKLLFKMLTSNLKDVNVIYTTPVGYSLVAATLIAAKIKKIPVTITPAYHYYLDLYKIDNKFWSRILRKYTMIFPHTYAEMNYLKKIGVPKKIQKKMGVGLAFKKMKMAGNGNWRKRLNISGDKFTILYLNSSISDYYKGIESVIKSSIQLPSIYFIFVGRTKKDWEVLKKKYKLYDAKNISYIEFLSTKEKYQLLNSVDLIVKPSLSESFGIVLFEGLSAGKPIITSNIEPMRELSKNVGLSVEFNNPEELVKQIKFLRDNKEIYKELSKNALIKAEKYSWENLGKKFEREFKKLAFKQ